MPTEPDLSFSTPEFGTEPRPKRQLIEVLVFLFLIVPSLAVSAIAGTMPAVSFVPLAISVILRDLALVSLVLFFLWQNGEPFERIGWRWAGRGREIAWGLALFVPFAVGAGLLDSMLQGAGLTAPKHPPSALQPAANPWQLILATILVMVVAVAEETIFRGYLLLRFRAVTKRLGRAVVLSAVVFAVGHGYEGSAGIITVGVMGVVFALIYLWRQSLVAPIVMHFLQDFLSIVVASVTGAK